MFSTALRRPTARMSRTRRLGTAAVLAGAGGMLVLAGTGSASAATGASASQWQSVAQCEASGNWAANTGNGFSGGLQFTPSTWAAYGGTQYASAANLATPQEQMAVANHVLAEQGPGAWPVCGAKAGL
ncbi:transglycosylase family protein [Streptomyces endophyticus]|uniref:transglycosylase family protein n=1 Tax=Streptomyces endophyticus TaxID=714166 RepID=UPI002DB853BE|nr:transglycosylase family protein [Streptomyces endophyticus]